ncbi:MAG: hypothetical protein EA385_03665 [Salinarimonadaceae bacterium]|nr:MAG: hypothetical protein EA385_03665 [Salinarimonadaceae bacterium]
MTLDALNALAGAFVEKGDLGHLALLGWAVAASGFAASLHREAAAASRRFDEFVRELAIFNRRHSGECDP